MDDRKEHILVAARRIFAEKSYSQATISEIASKADVARGSLHYHFKNKEDLFVQVLKSIYEHSLGPKALDRIAAEDGRQLAKMTVFFIREALNSTPEFFLIIYESLSVTRQSTQVREALVDFWKGYRKETESIIATMQNQSVIESKRTPEAIVTILISLIHGFAIQVMCEPEIVELEENWTALERALTDLFEK